MNRFIFLFILFFSLESFAKVFSDRGYEEKNIVLNAINVSPLHHYWEKRKERFSERTGDVIVLNVDLDGNGENDFLITDSLLRGSVYGHRWQVYLQHMHKYWYVKGKELDRINFDHSWAYIGYIDEIEQHGIIFYVKHGAEVGGTLYTTIVQITDASDNPIAKIIDHKAISKYIYKHWIGSRKDKDMHKIIKKYFFDRSSNIETLKIYAVDKSWVPPEQEKHKGH